MNVGPDSLLGAGLILAALALWWHSSNQARELAREHARRFCRKQEWQLLDQTVALVFMRPDRQTGRWQWRRLYRFDFSPDGGSRRSGELVMFGSRLAQVSAELEEGGKLVE